MPAMVVMGLDVSTKTGVAVVREQTGNPEVMHTGVLRSKRLGIERADDIGGQVVGLINSYHPRLVVIEGYGFANEHSLATLVEIGTVVRYLVYHLGRPMLVVPPATLKIFATGKGNARKDQIALHLFKTYGFEADTDDEADAFALAVLGLAHAGKLRRELPKTHLRAVDKLPKTAEP